MASNITRSLVPQFQSGGKRDLSRKYAQSDDSVMVRQIRETHSSESHYIDVKPVLIIIEDILRRTAPGIEAAINVSSFFCFLLSFFSCLKRQVLFYLLQKTHVMYFFVVLLYLVGDLPKFCHAGHT